MTDRDDEMVQVNVQVPRADRDQYLATHEHGELSRQVRDLIAREAWGEEVSAGLRTERRLDTLEDELDQLRDERDELDRREAVITTERAQLRDRLDQLDDREDAYADALDTCSDILRGGGRLFPEHGKVEAAARAGGVEPDAVIARLKERHPGAPDHAFLDRREDPRPWGGLE